MTLNAKPPRRVGDGQPGAGSPRPQRNLAQRLFSGTAWALAFKIVSLVSGLAVNAFLARLLPPDQLGAYFLALSIASFAAIIARFGLKQTVVRLVAEAMAAGQPGRAGESLRIAYGITAVGTVLVGSALYLGVGAWLAESVFEIPVLQTATGLLAAWIAIHAFETPIAETFRGLHDIRLASLLSGVLANLLLAVALGSAWGLGVTVSFAEVLGLSVACGALSLGFGTLLLLRQAPRLRGSGTVSPVEVVRISGPLFVTNLAVQGYTSFSLWVVGAFMAAEDVAIYGAAWKLVNLVALPLTFVGAAVQPFIAELHVTGDRARLQNALSGTATLAGLPTLIVLIAFIVFGADILGLVFGEHYAQGALILAILSAGQAVKVWTGTSGQVLSFTGHQRQLMTLTVVTGIVGAAVMLAAVKLGGLVGVAIAASGARVVQNLSEWLLVRRLTGLWTHAVPTPRFVRDAARRVIGNRHR